MHEETLGDGPMTIEVSTSNWRRYILNLVVMEPHVCVQLGIRSSDAPPLVLKPHDALGFDIPCRIPSCTATKGGIVTECVPSDEIRLLSAACVGAIDGDYRRLDLGDRVSTMPLG